MDVIYIVLPNSMHAEYTIRGLQAGKNVLTEKPMAVSPAQCQAMIDAANKANRKLMVAYRCRYEPYNQEMIRMAREKELGAGEYHQRGGGLQYRRPGTMAAEEGDGRRRIVDGYREFTLCRRRGISPERNRWR